MSRHLTTGPLSGTVLARATAGIASLALAATLTSCSFEFGELEPVGEDATPPDGVAAAEESETTEQAAEDGAADDGAADDGTEETTDAGGGENGLPSDPAEAQVWADDNYWLSGTGEALYKLDWTPTSGTALSLSHSGSSNFIIVTYGADETRYASIVNEIGAYEGDVTLGDLPLVDGPEAVEYLHIQADGPWTIGR